MSSPRHLSTFPSDPELKRKHLTQLGFNTSSRLNWLHIRAAVVAGLGFFTDAYDMCALNITVLILGYIYYANFYNIVPPLTDLSVKLASLLGIIFGQLLFGWMADRIGRKRIYVAELALILVGTIASCFSSNAVRGISVFGMLCICRVITGLGIGGDITLSGVIVSEFAHTTRRGAMVATVFAMQGLGVLAAATVSAVILVAFQSAINSDQFMLDYVWRIVFAVGLVPAVISLLLRLRIPETPRYLHEQHVRATLYMANGGAGRAYGLQNSGSATWGEFFAYFRPWYRARVLIGVSLAWFCSDLVYYGTQLNNSTILRMSGIYNPSNPFGELLQNVIGQLIMALLGTVPGYLAAIFLIDRIGRRALQFIGFGVLAVIYCGFAVAYWYLLFYSYIAFIAVFAVAQFFLALGPATTTFVIPAEVFPTRYRTTAFGLAAAVGKLGAIVSQVGFSMINLPVDGEGIGVSLMLDTLMYVFAGVMVLGVIATVLVKETIGKSLEELQDEMDAPPPATIPTAPKPVFEV